MDFIKNVSAKKVLGVSVMTLALMAAAFYVGKKYY